MYPISPSSLLDLTTASHEGQGSSHREDKEGTEERGMEVCGL